MPDAVGSEHTDFVVYEPKRPLFPPLGDGELLRVLGLIHSALVLVRSAIEVELTEKGIRRRQVKAYRPNIQNKTEESKLEVRWRDH